MSRCPRVLFLASLLAVALAAVAVLAHRLDSSRRLLAYKAELLRKGEKLSYGRLTASRLTNRNDSIVIITNAAARLRSANLESSWLNLRKYVRPGVARARCLHKLPGPGGQAEEASWGEIALELAKIQAPLADLRQEMKNPQRDWSTSQFTALPDFVAIRSAAQWLVIDALAECHNGRLEEGLQDIEALIGLARLNQDEYSLVAQMIRVAVAGLGSAATWEALQVHGWTEQQLQRLQAAWQQVDLAEALETGITGERATGEELWSALRRTNGLQNASSLLARPIPGPPTGTHSFADFFSERIYYPFYRMTSMDDDELRYLKCMQGSLDALRSLRDGPSWPKVSRDLERAFGQPLHATRSFERYRLPLSSIALPNFLKAIATGARIETERQLTLTAIALARFQLAHREPPRSLDLLVPTYLPTLPRDLMGGRPLQYTLKAGQVPTLYSVGTDGEDNGGDGSSDHVGKFGLWEGRDAVWPAGEADGEPLR